MAPKHVPEHVGLIMDGNGRWAKKRLMPRNVGHSAGMRTMIRLARHAANIGIKYLTVYALSTENILNRPQEELDGLYALLRKYFTGHVKELYESGARVKVIGDISALPPDICELLQNVERDSSSGAGFTLTFAINYGARSEIARAARLAFEEGGEITEESISRSMYTYDLPDPDLIIRTGGEVRLSNFLLWQAAYAELYFTPVLFPDFNVKEFDKALKDYSSRNRRFGGIK